MNQIELIKPEMQKLDSSVVGRQASMTGALILCQTLSGLEDKELCGKGNIISDPATWSRIKGGSNCFPQDRMNKYMDLCGNEAPLIWLAASRGYDLVEKETEWERQARIERTEKEELQKEVLYLRNLVAGRSA